MSRLLNIIMVMGAGLIVAAGYHSAKAASTTGNATATVAAALSVSETTPMSFGVFNASPEGGSITTNNIVTGVTTFSPANPATFTVVGAQNSTVRPDLTLPTITLSNGLGNSMSAAIAVSSPTIGLGSEGTNTFDVTGTLTIGPNQASGTYSGTYEVTVDYTS